ncbi:hypothetical protein BASA60_000744 [Batrachochytrium salamandrivorans]|nr:hypothetical protein BASA60_000744 [Batrachochytrium salamandrivorans]
MTLTSLPSRGIDANSRLHIALSFLNSESSASALSAGAYSLYAASTLPRALGVVVFCCLCSLSCGASLLVRVSWGAPLLCLCPNRPRGSAPHASLLAVRPRTWGVELLCACPCPDRTSHPRRRAAPSALSSSESSGGGAGGDALGPHGPVPPPATPCPALAPRPSLRRWPRRPSLHAPSPYSREGLARGLGPIGK